MEQTFFVAGGDARQEAIIHQFKEAGRSVSALGFQAADHLTPEIAAHLGSADIILLPACRRGQRQLSERALYGKTAAYGNAVVSAASAAKNFRWHAERSSAAFGRRV